MALIIPSIYRFTQTTPATSWAINHNLGANGSKGIPIVDAFISVNGVMTKIMPASIQMVDANNVTLTFTEARSGFAVIIV